MVRQNSKITSEEDAQVEPQADQPGDQPQQLTTNKAPQPGAFPFPGDTQSGGTRNPDPNFVSSAVAYDVAQYGWAIDPASGQRITVEDLKARGYELPTEPPRQESE